MAGLICRSVNRKASADMTLKTATEAELRSTITCPACGHQHAATMPTDACVYIYDCSGCGTRLKPEAGDCCVFCSYGSVPCPPIQTDGHCCSP